MSDLGLYYAEKIRGACDLALFDKSGDAAQQTSAVHHLQVALTHWQDYAKVYSIHHIEPRLYGRVGHVDIADLTKDVAADMLIAREWKPGTGKNG